MLKYHNLNFQGRFSTVASFYADFQGLKMGLPKRMDFHTPSRTVLTLEQHNMQNKINAQCTRTWVSTVCFLSETNAEYSSCSLLTIQDDGDDVGLHVLRCRAYGDMNKSWNYVGHLHWPSLRTRTLAEILGAERDGGVGDLAILNVCGKITDTASPPQNITWPRAECNNV